MSCPASSPWLLFVQQLPLNSYILPEKNTMLIYLYLTVRPSACPCCHVSNIRDRAPGVVYVRPWYENASLEPYVCPFICCCQGRNFRNSPAREINEIIKYDNLRLYVRLLYHFHVDSSPKVQFWCPAMSVRTSHVGLLLLIYVYTKAGKRNHQN